jgi:hypothetical protein
MTIQPHVRPTDETRVDPSVLWQHCRNSVGIARLLLHERRPADLLDTACRAALEYGCRAALGAARRPFSGDLLHGLESLQVPRDLLLELSTDETEAARRLAATERLVAWMSAELKREAPERHWRY